jgi:hypothetical protein
MSQKKHQLAQNELANALAQRLETLRPHTGRILLGTGFVIAAILICVWWWNARKVATESQWQAYMVASDEMVVFGDNRLLQTIADEFPDSATGRLSLMTAADFELATGSAQLPTDRPQGRRKLESAKRKYEMVLAKANGVDTDLQRRATYGLAYACEALGELDEAQRHYQQLVDAAGDSSFGELAREGLKRVTAPSSREIFTALAAWEPPTTAPSSPLPIRPDISFPESDTPESVGADESGPELQPPAAADEADKAPDTPPGD